MTDLVAAQAWRALTPGQRTMLQRLGAEGSLHSLGPWEMRTVRSLLERRLVRPRLPGRTGRDVPGLWFLSAKGRRILSRQPSAAGGAEARSAPPHPETAAAEMPR